MAAGAFIVPDKALLNIYGRGLLAGSDYRIALVGSGWTPVNSADELWADASAYEIVTGNGYSAGGAALPSVALTQVAGVAKFTADPVTFTPSGGAIPAWRRAVLYCLGTVGGRVNPIVGHWLGDAAGIDVPSTPVGQVLTLTPDAIGILTSAPQEAGDSLVTEGGDLLLLEA